MRSPLGVLGRYAQDVMLVLPWLVLAIGEDKDIVASPDCSLDTKRWGEVRGKTHWLKPGFAFVRGQLEVPVIF